MEGEGGLLGESDTRRGGGVIEHASIELREQWPLEGGRKLRP
jgi:hypothetical protein